MCFKLTSPTWVEPPPSPAFLPPPASFATGIAVPWPIPPPTERDALLPGFGELCGEEPEGDNESARDGTTGSAGVLPGAFAPRSFWPLDGVTPAADSRREDVGGVRSMKWKERSGRMVMSDGIGTPGLM